METITKKEALQLGIIGADGLGFVKPQTAYRNVNERLLAEIKKGNLVWRKGWREGIIVEGKSYGPQNYETQRPYKGGNAFFIAMINLLNGTNYNYFLTKKQIAEHGGKLTKEAQAFPISYVISGEKTKEVKKGGKIEEITEEYKGMIWHFVYAIDQVEGLAPIKRKNEDDTWVELIVPDADLIIKHMPKRPVIKHNGESPAYYPAEDYIQMPYKKSFDPQSDYFCTIFHELVHSTMHKTRLNRDLEYYATEELVAELGAVYLCEICGIDYTINNSAAYLEGWVSRLCWVVDQDPNFFKRVVFHAVKAAKYILGNTIEKYGVESGNSEQSKQEHFPGAEVKPNKSVKASVSQAIKDLIALPEYRQYSPMFLGMFYADFKDSDELYIYEEGLKYKMYFKYAGLLASFADYLSKDKIVITEAGRALVDKIKARLQTLKNKKGGQDLFPELAGAKTAASDGLVLFLNAMLEMHGRTVSREELEAIIEELRAYASLGIIAATHPLKNVANTIQLKVVTLINKLKPGQRVPVQITNKKKIENRIQSLHGLGFWPVIASAVIGKGAELLAAKHFFKKPEALNGISDGIIDELISLYEQAELHKRSNKSIITGTISAAAAEQLRKKYDLDLKGYKHLVTFADARHIYKMHGEGRETNKRQAAVTPVDFALYPYVVDNYDTVEFEVNERKEKTLKYTKYISNYFVVVEEIVEKYKTLKLKTLYIKKTKPPVKTDGLTGSQSAKAKASPSIKRPKRASLVKPKVQKNDELQGLGFVRADDRKAVADAPGLFTLPGELGKLLGRIQPFKYAIVLTGDPHAGKTEVVTQLIDAFAGIGKQVGVYMLEQGGMESKDTSEAIDRNVSAANQKNMFVTGEAPKGLDTIKEQSKLFDVIVIDSWQKLGVPSTRFDELRHEFPDKIFITIFQQNGKGGTRGGVAADYDAPVQLKVHKVDETFTNNYVEVKKNRGNGETLSLKYLVKKRKTIKP